MTLLEGVTSARLLEALGWALVNFLWQGATIGIVAAIVLLALRRCSANARYLVCCAALALMAIAPVATFFIVFWAQGAAPVEFESAIVASAALETTWSDRVSSWLPSVALGYVIAALLLQLRLGVQLVHANSLKLRGCLAAPPAWRGIVNDLKMRLGLRRTVQVVESSVVSVPTVVGWLQPFVLVPVSAISGLSPDQLRAVLAHELAHIRRYDYLVNLIQAVIESLLFYHPAVWWLSRRMRDEREFCCDDIAVRVCGDSVCYARALSSLVSMRDEEPIPALASTGGSLMNRIRRLVGVRPATATRPGAATVAMFAVVAATVVISSLAFAVPAERAVQLPATAEEAAALASISAIDDGDGGLAERLRAAGLADEEIRIVLKIIESQHRNLAESRRRDTIRDRFVEQEVAAVAEARGRANRVREEIQRRHVVEDERRVRTDREHAAELHRHLQERLAAGDLAEADVARLVERAMEEAGHAMGRIERQHGDGDRRPDVERHLQELHEHLQRAVPDELKRHLHEALTHAYGEAQRAYEQGDMHESAELRSLIEAVHGELGKRLEDRAIGEDDARRHFEAALAQLHERGINIKGDQLHEVEERLNKLHQHLQKQLESSGVPKEQIHEHLGKLHEHLQKQLESVGISENQLHEHLRKQFESAGITENQLHEHLQKQFESAGITANQLHEHLRKQLESAGITENQLHEHLRKQFESAGITENQLHEHLRKQLESSGVAKEQLHEHLGKLREHLQKQLESSGVPKEQIHQHLEQANKALKQYYEQLQRHQSEGESSPEAAIRERLHRELLERDRGAVAEDERRVREHLRRVDESEARSRSRHESLSAESIEQLLEHMHKLQDHLHQGLESGRISKEQAREHLLDAQRKLEAALQELREEGGRRRPRSR